MISFGSLKADSIYFSDKGVAEIYFGNKLIWSGKRLIMGSDKYVCIEFTAPDTIISSSQNPITISVFMNTNNYTDTNPPMWIINDTGTTVGFSSNGIVGQQETIKKCTGYKRTNTFTDNQLYLNEGKTYYACYRITQWDNGNNYFAYYNKGTGNYKICEGLGNISKNPVNKAQYNNIGTLTSFADVIEANEDDLFTWNGITKCGLTANNDYARKGDSLNNYVPELNYGNTDKYEVLNHILMMDKGSGQYGGAGDKFVITESYTDGPIGVIERTNNYTSHVFIPPSPGFFHRNADAYKYIFDPAVNLTENKALVWGNDYIYTNGSCYSRGSQYIGYSCYESRTNGQYINSPSDLANVSANELFYVDDNVKDSLNTSKGLKIRGNTTFDTTCTVADGNDFYAAFRTVAAATDSGKAFTTVTQNSTYQWFNAIYEKKSGWQNKIGSSAITVEPSNPSTGDVYWKGTTTSGWINQWGGSITEECLVKWGGSSWIKVETHQEQDYFTTTDASNLFSSANTNGILNGFQPSQLYQEVNINSLVTTFEKNDYFRDLTVYDDKKYYLEFSGHEV